MDIRREIANVADAFLSFRISLDQFENSFRDIAQQMFAQPPDVRAVLVAIENLLAELRANYIDRPDFRQELAAAILPFESAARVLVIAPKIWKHRTGENVYRRPPDSASFSANDYSRFSAAARA
jgi:hypothetical protein